MTTFKILIVEDEELYADKLEMLVDKLGYEHIATVDNSTDALSIIKQTKPDLILMDVHIKGAYDGIELTDLIHKEQPIPVIFITSMMDDLTFNRATRANPINFLNKPFNDLQLQRSIELSIRQLNSVTKIDATQDWEEDIYFEDFFYIKNRHKLDKVAVADVLYLEADGHYCFIHTKDKRHLVRISMTDLASRLVTASFLQTHRSFLVNLKKIQSVDLQDSVVVVEGKHIPVSKRNREILLKKLDWI